MERTATGAEDKPTTLLVTFLWDSAGGNATNMPMDDVRLALEHWVRWSSYV